ncbi:MAG: HTTM domain-containing protein [Leptospiraceae bacterium]|nr:HTTM domain-containing protein [Leptospiraceae bacterium]
MMEIDKFKNLLNRNVSGLSISALRIFYGIIALILVGRYFYYDWINEYFVKPKFFFKHFGWEWIYPLPYPWIYFQFLLMFLLGILITIGHYTKVSLLGFIILFHWFHFADSTIFLNHYYFLTILGFLLFLAPTERNLSLDSKFTINHKIPFLWVFVFRFQFGLVYFFAGIAKLKKDWLLEALPLKLWLNATFLEYPFLDVLLNYKFTPFTMSWAGAIFDLSISFLLIPKRTRKFAWLMLFIFHSLTSFLLPIGVFPLAMILGSFIFFSPNWPVVVLRKVPRNNFFNFKTKPFHEKETENKFIYTVLLFHFFLQIFLPLRHFFYKGNVLWTENGFKYSWHVMVAEKLGEIEFFIKVRDSKFQIQTISINPKNYLTSYQYKMMAISPEHILQFANFLKKEFENQNFSVLEITVNSLVSLNGKKAQSLFSKETNLLTLRDNIFGISEIQEYKE